MNLVGGFGNRPPHRFLVVIWKYWWHCAGIKSEITRCATWCLYWVSICRGFRVQWCVVVDQGSRSCDGDSRRPILRRARKYTANLVHACKDERSTSKILNRCLAFVISQELSSSVHSYAGQVIERHTQWLVQCSPHTVSGRKWMHLLSPCAPEEMHSFTT